MNREKYVPDCSQRRRTVTIFFARFHLRTFGNINFPDVHCLGIRARSFVTVGGPNSQSILQKPA